MIANKQATQPLKAQSVNQMPAEPMAGYTTATAYNPVTSLMPPSKFEQENIHSSAPSFIPQLQTTSQNFVPTASANANLIFQSQQ